MTNNVLEVKQPSMYEPFPKQLLFHNSPAQNRLFGGAAGPGKSHAFRMEAVRIAESTPGLKIGLFRRTYPELYSSVIEPLLETLPQWCPWDDKVRYYKYNDSKKIMTFYNGSRLYFGHVQYDKDVFKYQGAQFDAIGIDELTLFNEFQFRFLKSRLRTTKPNWRPCFFATTNPGNIGHAWVKRIWIDKDLTSKEKKETYEYIPALVYDNPVLCENDPDYVDRLENLDEDTKKAMLYGDWDSFQGQYFKEWRRDIHVIKPFAIPKEWRRVIALDYGYSNPSAVLWLAIDPDDNVYCYRELYVTKHLYDKLCEEIKMRTGPGEKIFAMIADPALQAKAQDTGRSFFDVAKKHGFNILPGINDRLPGWDLVREYLKVETDERGEHAKLKIFSTCENLIRTLPQLIHDMHKVEDVDTDGEDHAPDALRYGLKFLSRRSATLKEVASVNEEKAKPKDDLIISTRF